MATWLDNLEAINGNLLAIYNFEGVAGAVVDDSPAGNDGSIVSTVTRGVTGKIGDAFEYTQAGYTDTGIVLPSTCTYAFWVKRDTLGTFQGIVGDRTGGSNCTLYFETDGDIRYSGGIDINAGTGITDTNWHMVMVSVNPTTVNVWIDNVNIISQADTRSTGAGELFIGDDGQGGTNDLDGLIDLMAIWSIELNSSQRADYYNGGTGLEYVPSKDGSPFATTRLVNDKDGSEFTSIKLVKEKDGASFASIKLVNPKDGSGFSTIKLNHEKQGSSFVTTQLRVDGIQSYSFELYNSSDILEASATGSPPQIVFPDLFTGVSDGAKTLYVRSVQKYKNLENTINETMYKFRLLAGVLQPLLPNLPLSVSAEAKIGALVEVSWNYSPTNEEIAPTTFEVYAGAVSVDTVTYTGATSYKVTLGPFSEVPTVFSVSSLNGVDETIKVAAESVTPDGTPPETVPFTFRNV